MQQSAEASLMSFIPLLLMSVLFGVVGHFLAKDKERPVLRWTILSAIPFVNFFCLTFLVGSTNLRIEQKLDAILKAQGAKFDYR
jgi:predicted neutral ceramidase superfamily lipid hydrolase